jgi:hypothetical protein
MALTVTTVSSKTNDPVTLENEELALHVQLDESFPAPRLQLSSTKMFDSTATGK